MATNFVGSIAECNWDEPFLSYIERFEQYIIVNDVTETKKKVPLFLTIIGPKCYEVLRNSVLPAKPSEKTYKDLSSTKVLRIRKMYNH